MLLLMYLLYIYACMLHLVEGTTGFERCLLIHVRRFRCNRTSFRDSAT